MKPGAIALYEGALNMSGATLLLRTACGRALPLQVARWCGPPDPADEELLRRCRAPYWSIGCGPGRLTIALAERGIPVLGVDISRTAVARVPQAGACAIRRSVFDPLPGQGRWVTALLADGNIGIGGYPDELLRRCEPAAGSRRPAADRSGTRRHRRADDGAARTRRRQARPDVPLGPAGRERATQTRGRRRPDAFRGMAAHRPGFCFRHHPKPVNSKQLDLSRCRGRSRIAAEAGVTGIASGWIPLTALR